MKFLFNYDSIKHRRLVVEMKTHLRPSYLTDEQHVITNSFIYINNEDSKQVLTIRFYKISS